MNRKNIYIVQFGTGSNINLLPLAAGQLVARLKQERELLEKYNLCEIVFKRPENPKELVSQIEDVFIIGFSCFLWNVNVSLQTAKEVKKRFPEALIVAGGPSIPKDPESSTVFFRKNPAIDVVCTGEGEEVFVLLCRHRASKTSFGNIPGIIYRDRKTGGIYRTAPEKTLSMDKIPSPYLDNTFDGIYRKYSSEFSGIIWETNRGCPFECSFCTWGNLPSRKIREKPMEQVRDEIEWIGRNKIKYIAMSDSNFGIRERDITLAEMLADCKQRYGVPHFISVSWAKNSPDKVLKISKILKEHGIGYRVTLSLQSLKEDVLKAVNRINIKKDIFEKIKTSYRNCNLYSYTELILGLPLETYKSFLSGIERSLSMSIFEQLYVYPLFLFPNTKIASSEFRKKYKIESKIIENRYTKSKESTKIKEFVEIVVGTSTMPKHKWVDSFVEGFYTLALHDDRLAFFVLTYLKKNYGIPITDFVSFLREMCSRHNFYVMKESLMRLQNCALDVQKKGRTHLIEPKGYGNVPFDPPDGIFLELLLKRDRFYPELLAAVWLYLEHRNINFDKSKLENLFVFQEAVMAHPDGPRDASLSLKYDWIEYFGFTFQLKESALKPMQRNLRVIDPDPCNGDAEKFLKYHFDIRGVPAFNKLFTEDGVQVFPPVNIQHMDEQVQSDVTAIVA